jgi:hypothetical protein
MAAGGKLLLACSAWALWSEAWSHLSRLAGARFADEDDSLVRVQHVDEVVTLQVDWQLDALR